MTVFAADLVPLFAQFGPAADPPDRGLAVGGTVIGLIFVSSVLFVAAQVLVGLAVFRLIVRKLFRNERDLIVEEIIHDPGATGDATVLQLVGRRGGLGQLLLSLFGIHTRAEFRVTGRDVRLSYGSPAAGLEYVHVLPLVQKPSVLVAYRGMGLFQLLAYAVVGVGLLLMLIVNPCNALTLGLLAVAFMYEFVVDRAFAVTVAGHSAVSVCFQKAVFGAAVDFAQVGAVLGALREAVLGTEEPSAPEPVRRPEPATVRVSQPPPLPPRQAVPSRQADGRLAETESGVLPLSVRGSYSPPPSLDELKIMLEGMGETNPEAGLYKTIMLAVGRAFRDVEPEVAVFCEEVYFRFRKGLPRGTPRTPQEKRQTDAVCALLQRFGESVYAQRGLNVVQLVKEIRAAG